jgi:hypothetical protein
LTLAPLEAVLMSTSEHIKLQATEVRAPGTTNIRQAAR